MRKMRTNRSRRAIQLVPGLLAAMLVAAMGVLPACAATTGTDEGHAAEVSATQESDQQSSAGATTGQDADAATADADADGTVEEDAPIEWPDECTDRRGDMSVYALCELTGAELETLLEQQDYVWSSRDQTWLKGNGSAALIACAPSGSYLSREQMAELGRSVDEEGVSYRIVTSRYSNPRRAFDILAGRVMTCEDVEYTDLGVVGVVQGEAPETRALVVATEGDGVVVVSVFGEKALAAGMLDDMADRSLGATIDEAFEALVGRPLATIEPQE